MLSIFPTLILTAFFVVDPATGDMMGISASHSVGVTFPPAQVEQVIDALVPFTSQAPFANWADPRKRDGCEEASIVMAARWANGSGLTAQEADLAIDNLSAFGEARFSTYIDSSIADTATMLRDYAFVAGDVRYDVGASEMIAALKQGSILIVPVDGSRLGNPHFLDPPPTRHMLVVRGYDPIARQFIVNEPGTRFGDGYRYGIDVLEAALRDYPTGSHLPVLERRSAMLVVSRS